MYFAIAYDLWPHLTGRALDSFGLMRAQLWLWFIGMIVTTFPWHWVGILGMPRRMAFYDYTDPAIAPQAFSVSISAIGGFILLVSGVLFLVVLVRGQRAPRGDAGAYRFAVAVHHAGAVPVALNGFGLWLALMIGLTVINYGYPIAQLLALTGNLRARGLCRSAAMSDAPLFSFRNPWFSASVGVTAAIAGAGRVRRLHLAAAGAARPEARAASGTRSAAPPACRARRRKRDADPAGLQDLGRRDDVGDAAQPEPGLDRPRRDAGAALRDLPRAAGRQPTPTRPISPGNMPP